MLPKLMSDKTQMFRYSACRFRLESSKISTARFVISKEFNVTNSLTLESSFYGFLNEERKIIEFCSMFYMKVGVHLANTIIEYIQLLEEEILLKLRRIFVNKIKKRIYAKAKIEPKMKVNDIGKQTIVYNTIKKDSKNIDTNIIDNKNDDVKATEAEPVKEEVDIIRLEDCYDDSEKFIDIPKNKVLFKPDSAYTHMTQ